MQKLFGKPLRRQADRLIVDDSYLRRLRRRLSADRADITAKECGRACQSAYALYELPPTARIA
jgi:hypothetical protein